MATGVGDLVSHLEADSSDFVAGMEESAREVDQVTVVIHEQRASWMSLASTAIPAIGEMTASIAGLVGTLATIRHQREIVSGVSSSIAALGATTMRFIGPIARVVGLVVPQWRLVTTAVAATALAVKVGSSDTVRSMAGQVAATEQVRGATDRMGDAFDRIEAVMARPFDLAIGAITGVIDEINPFPSLIDMAAATVSAGANAMASGLEWVATEAEATYDSFEGLMLAVQNGEGLSLERAAAYRDEAQALREQARASEELTAKLEAQRIGFQQLGAIQQQAAASAQQQAEVSRIRSLTTIAALDEETRALQQAAGAAELNGTANEESRKRVAELFNAIESQRQAVLSGAVMPTGQREAEAALKSLDDEIARLTGSYEALAEARMREGGANEALLAEVRQRQELKRALDAQKEAEKEAAKQLEEETRRQNAAWERESETIAGLKDELALLTGAATKADLERRKALEAGFTEQGADEIAALTEQLEAARAKDRQKSERGVRDQSFQFASKGSSAALTTLFRAENRSNADERAAKAAEKSAKELEKANEALGALISATEQNGFVGMEIGGGP